MTDPTGDEMLAQTPSVPQNGRSIHDLSVLADFVELLHQLEEIRSVVAVRVRKGLNQMELWVLTDREDFADNKRIFRAARDFIYKDPSVPYDLRVVPLSEVCEDAIPDGPTVVIRHSA